MLTLRSEHPMLTPERRADLIAKFEKHNQMVRLLRGGPGMLAALQAVIADAWEHELEPGWTISDAVMKQVRDAVENVTYKEQHYPMAERT